MSSLRKHEEPCPRCRERGGDTRGDNLVVWPDGSAHCFSCSFHQFPKHYVPRRVEENVNKAILPADFTREVPTHALKWLLQYGLPYTYWKDSIGYSPSEERLVFLVGKREGGYTFSIGRFVGMALAEGTKAPRKWYVWGDSHKHCELVKPSQVEEHVAQDKIVLCEDLVSAHKIANAGYLAIPLFGTQVHKPHLYYLMNQPPGSIIVLWLDKDQQGTIMRKAVGLQALIGTQVRCVTTDNDPKALTFKEINEVLFRSCNS